jgi:branched-chain amino acid transport system permease protein
VTSAAAIERVLMIAFAVFLLSVPWLIPALVNAFWVSVIAEILIWSLFAASVNLLFGYVGLLSFGQALYFGFGMYGVAVGIDGLGLSFWPAFALGIIAAMAMALVTGIFAVRLTWHYFAIITVVFSLIFYFLALTNKWLTGGTTASTSRCRRPSRSAASSSASPIPSSSIFLSSRSSRCGSG